MLLKSKEEISFAAYDAALRTITQHASAGYGRMEMSHGSLMGQLAHLIALAVQAGIKEVLDSTYSNQEFEQDIGLDK